ncbi:GyrI-like domain-containing protein [Deinococcus cellulosilyticus]|uniref:GyrI-like small molecule binding domain-containing protein n=1 Tax=Deinococcus cellulosilyticus (strain DSM 18568 / NBRC 106333 / KACC 11606 / 5516J-15) TaxID=1223518 RepID=A0A511N015_DEIC1|nr:GyrI-like domain-containing protein [Deinococcus cellulosilyticus]GEM46163.1 hypothetical protein DC3_17980 [Deinococcus cellulosilyticus NBRC 106333 = KACC 11606]
MNTLLKAPRAPKRHDPELLQLPPVQCLMLDGTGDPNTAPAFKTAVSALYSLSYAIKFALKKLGTEHKVQPLEGLWWMGNEQAPEFDAVQASREHWHWTLMIQQPDHLTPALFEQIRSEVIRKKGLDRLSEVRLETFTEGQVAQVLHVGPFSAEGETIERLHNSIAAQALSISGKHHEIYLSDFTRAAPEKLKTLIRYPVTSR